MPPTPAKITTPRRANREVPGQIHDQRKLRGIATIPGGPEQAEKDAATGFESELPSLLEWRFGAEEAAKIKQPVFFLSGAESLPVFVECRDLFHSWWPRTEDDVMPGANHLLHIRHPADAAARLGAFLKRHAIAT